MKCPRCHAELTAENINIQSDIAQCTKCNRVFKVSENIEDSTEENHFDIDDTVKGTWIHSTINKTVIGASTRSPIAFFLVPFMIVWSGGSIGGLYGPQIVSGKFNLYLSLFGIPFLLGSVIFWSLALMAIWGKVEVSLDQNGGNVFTGIGRLGLNKSFEWNEVSTVKESSSNLKYPGGQGSTLVLEGQKRISFGSGLNAARRYYLLNAIKSTLSKNRWNKKLL